MPLYPNRGGPGPRGVPPQAFQRVEAVDEPVDRTEEQCKERQTFIDSFTPTNPDAVLIIRHQVKQKIGTLYIPQEYLSILSQKTTTGTVIKFKKGEETEDEIIKEGAYVMFSEYAPFIAYNKYPELQLVHRSDIVGVLSQMPADVSEIN